MWSKSIYEEFECGPKTTVWSLLMTSSIAIPLVNTRDSTQTDIYYLGLCIWAPHWINMIWRSWNGSVNNMELFPFPRKMSFEENWVKQKLKCSECMHSYVLLQSTPVGFLEGKNQRVEIQDVESLQCIELPGSVVMFENQSQIKGQKLKTQFFRTNVFGRSFKQLFIC